MISYLRVQCLRVLPLAGPLGVRHTGWRRCWGRLLSSLREAFQRDDFVCVHLKEAQPPHLTSRHLLEWPRWLLCNKTLTSTVLIDDNRM